MTMKNILFLTAMVALSSCQLLDVEVGNGNSIDTVINVGEFDSISSCCSLDIIYTQTEGNPGVTLTCDENLVGYYRIVVEGGTLVVDTKNFVTIKPKVKSFLTVNSPSLEGVSVSGSGSCQITSPLTSAGDIDFTVSGSGSARLNGNARSLKSSTSGSGRVDSKNLTLGE